MTLTAKGKIKIGKVLYLSDLECVLIIKKEKNDSWTFADKGKSTKKEPHIIQINDELLYLERFEKLSKNIYMFKIKRACFGSELSPIKKDCEIYYWIEAKID